MKLLISLFGGNETTSPADFKFATEVKELSFEDLPATICSKNWSPIVFNYMETPVNDKGEATRQGYYRKSSNMKSTRLLALDIDQNCTLEKAKEEFKDYNHIICTTRSHQMWKNKGKNNEKPPCDRFRVVILLKEEITCFDTYKATWNVAKEKWPFIDNCNDLARFYYKSTDFISSSKGIEFPISTKHSKARSKSSNTVQGEKRKLSKRTLNFIVTGEVSENWHQTFVSATFDLKRNGYSQGEAEEMLSKAAAHHAGELDETDKYQLHDIYENREDIYDQEDDQETDDGEAKNQGAKLIQMAEESCELFHDEEGKTYASVKVDDHLETFPLQSRNFKNWLAKIFYTQTKSAIRDQVKKEAMSVLEAKALYEGPTKNVHRRIAEYKDKIYVDLSNDYWEVVVVDELGWRVTKNSPVKFIRSRGMLPLPNPASKGNIELLKKYLNINQETEDDWHLIVGWLIGAYRPKGPYPIQTFLGEQGCAKSTQSRILRSLVDPFKAALRSLPRSEQDLFISANNSWVVAFDNLSGLTKNMSDSLCRLSTGGGYAARELFSDSDEVIIDVQRPMIINGIDEISTRGDLTERMIVLSLPVISKDRRQEEAKLWESFEKDKPAIFAALLNGVSCAIKNRSEVELAERPRMADFAAWVVAAEEGLGLKKGLFLSAYNRNKDGSISATLDASPTAQAIIKFAKANSEWVGSASELIDKLEKYLPDRETNRKYYPTTGQRMGNELRRLAPALRIVGIEIEELPRKNQKRPWKIQFRSKSSPSSLSLVRDKSDSSDNLKQALKYPRFKTKNK